MLDEFNAVERLTHAKSAEHLLVDLHVMSKQLGATGVTWAHRKREGGPMQSRTANFPDGWLEHFVENDFVSTCPIVRHSRQSLTPFTLRDVQWDRKTDRAASRVVGEAAEFGLTDGFWVPVRMLDGSNGCVAFITEDTLSETDRHWLQVMAFAAHMHLINFDAASVARQATLTTREREILCWIAAGKTSDDIGAILSISHRTVEFHLQKVSQKLNVFSRTQAVVEAYRLGEIRL